MVDTLRAGCLPIALSLVACGAISHSALDARAAQDRACEAKPPDERLACVEGMTPLTPDEPREGDCAGHADAEGWTTVAAPHCLDFLGEASQERLSQRDLANKIDDCFVEPSTVEDAASKKQWCQARLVQLDNAAECLRNQASGQWANVHGVSISCFVRLERDRQRTLERLAAFPAVIAKVTTAESDRNADLARQQQAQAQRLDAEFDDEVRTGRCSQRHVDAYRAAVPSINQLFSSMSTGGDYWTVEDTDFIVATPDGTARSIKVPTGGDIHLFSVGLREQHIQINVKDSKGYDVNAESPFAVMMAQGDGRVHIASREVQVRPGETLAAKFAGKGCILVVLARK